LESIDAIAEIDPSVAPSNAEIAVTGGEFGQAAAAYVPSIIVLLTDGVSNSGPDPLDAADQAVGRGVRVYTIGFGTAEGSETFGRQGREGGGMFGSDPFGGNNQSFGGWFRRGIDEATLRDIADMTGGEYYQASSASELHQVFENLPTYLITRPETMEISVAFAAVGALLAALAIVLSLLWHPLT
jgi:Ca-activated chloride channel family protein